MQKSITQSIYWVGVETLFVFLMLWCFLSRQFYENYTFRIAFFWIMFLILCVTTVLSIILVSEITGPKHRLYRDLHPEKFRDDWMILELRISGMLVMFGLISMMIVA